MKGFDLRPHPNPAIESQKAVYLDGYMVALCGVEPDKPVCIIGALADPADRKRIEDFVKESIGAPSSVSEPPKEWVDDLEGE